MPAATTIQTRALAQFQDDFARALLDPDATPGGLVASLARQPGFAVYRNTVMKACIDALQANYRTVARLVGQEWFRAAAAIFVRRNPPENPSLIDYGAGFAGFLGEFPPAVDLPYLAGVAMLDRFWSESHTAPDETPLAAMALAALDANALGAVVLRPHASARWQWFADLPVATLWQANRDPEPDMAGDIKWRGEGMLVVRPESTVTWLQMDRRGIAFLDACRQGQPAGEAAQAALAIDAATDLPTMLGSLIRAGAFSETSVAEHQQKHCT